MAERKQSFAEDECYHIYNRGTEKRLIFLDKQDYEHFIYLMYICNTAKSLILRDISKNFDRGQTIVDIGAYCLMPNHFHFLIYEKMGNGISTYMRKLMTAYSMYFNKKYNRTGKLYEGVFKSNLCGTDRYLKYMYSYIHLNPAKLIDKNWKKLKNINTKTIFSYISNYKYSSINEYLTLKYKIINPEPFPVYFGNSIDHKRELLEWLDYNETSQNT